LSITGGYFATKFFKHRLSAAAARAYGGKGAEEIQQLYQHGL